MLKLSLSQLVSFLFMCDNSVSSTLVTLPVGYKTK